MYNQARKSLEQSAWLGHLWEKCPEKENWEGFNFAQTPHLSHIYLPSRRTVFCVLERSTPFQLKCHSQISCWRGKRRSTHTLFFQHLVQVPALGSVHSTTTIPAPHQEGTPGPRPRPQSGLPNRVSRRLPAWTVEPPEDIRFEVCWGQARTAGGVSLQGRKTASP